MFFVATCFKVFMANIVPMTCLTFWVNWEMRPFQLMASYAHLMLLVCSRMFRWLRPQTSDVMYRITLLMLLIQLFLKIVSWTFYELVVSVVSRTTSIDADKSEILPVHNLTSSQSYQFTILPVHNLTSSQSYQFTILPVQKIAIVPVHNLTSSQSYQFTILPVHKIAILPVHNLTSSQNSFRSSSLWHTNEIKVRKPTICSKYRASSAFFMLTCRNMTSTILFSLTPILHPHSHNTTTKTTHKCKDSHSKWLHYLCNYQKAVIQGII